jgi:outer membrane lipoprotein
MGRMRRAGVCIGLLAMSVAGLDGCHRYQVIPEPLQAEVNRNVTFEDLKRDPARYEGQTVVLGGEVLRATRLADHTRIEVLQTPLSSDFLPAAARSASRGRFIAYDYKGAIVDPAILQEGTRVTIVGEVQRPVTEPLGQGEYVYPTVGIRDMTVWEVGTGLWPAGPFVGPYWGAYPYGFLPYSFWSGTRVTG